MRTPTLPEAHRLDLRRHQRDRLVDRINGLALIASLFALAIVLADAAS